MWRDIKDYEGLYEINENAVVRRVEGKGIDGRKVTTHVVVSSKTRKGTRYIALWKNGNRKTFMLHKLYAEAFYMSENEACRRLYKGFIGTECQRYFAQEPVGSGKRTVDWREQTR